MLLIDSEAFISTGNMSYSLFKYNKDFLIELDNPELLGVLETLFMQDFMGEK